MTRVFRSAIFSLIAVVPGIAHSLDFDIDAVLEQINTMNRVAETYSVTVDVASFVPGREPQVVSMRNYIRGIETVLAVYTEPAKDRGKKILMTEGKMWMYFPKAGQSIIIRPSGTLFGTVTTGDILSPPLLDLYELANWTTIGTGQEERLVLTFHAIGFRAPYGRVDYHFGVEESKGRILYSECYTRSGILLKKAYFTDFVDARGGTGYASRIRYESAVDQGSYVLIRLSEFREQDIMDYYFTPEGLEHVVE